MLQTIKKAWAIPELRKKIVFTALILLIFRIGNAIPVPYVDTGLLSTYLQQMSTTVQPDNAQTRGKVAKIGYLLQVTEVE